MADKQNHQRAHDCERSVVPINTLGMRTWPPVGWRPPGFLRSAAATLVDLVEIMAATAWRRPLRRPAPPPSLGQERDRLVRRVQPGESITVTSKFAHAPDVLREVRFFVAHMCRAWTIEAIEIDGTSALNRSRMGSEFQIDAPAPSGEMDLVFLRGGSVFKVIVTNTSARAGDFFGTFSGRLDRARPRPRSA
jgi:hypothetical protein